MVAFGFGGRVCQYSQQLQQVKVISIGDYVQEGGAGAQDSGLRSSGSGFSQEKSSMDAFGGPLLGMRQGQVKASVQKFFSESYKSRGGPGSSEDMCVKVLGILVQHCDKLSKLPSPELSQQIAAALLAGEGGVGGGSDQNGNGDIGFATDGYAAQSSDSPLKTGFQQMDPNEAAGRMQRLLCEGKREEALQVALEGQVWGPALALAQSMGPEKFSDTVSAMSAQTLVKNSPLERLMGSIADTSVPLRNASSSSLNSMTSQSDSNHQRSSSGFFGGESFAGQGFGFLNSAGKDKAKAEAMAEEVQSPYAYSEASASSFSSWDKSLCILANNRKEWKNLGIKQLGDDVIASDVFGAHLCYVLSCYELEPFTDASKLCLVGMGAGGGMTTLGVETRHIQLTEVYEWLICQHTAQHVSYAFQPYKLLYAHRLLDYGNIGAAAKYCQSILNK